MKIIKNSGNGYIRGVISSHESSNEFIPKRITLLDEKLRVLAHQWMTGQFFELEGLKGGDYVVRLTLTSGVVREQVVHVNERQMAEVNFELGGISPMETQEWAYMMSVNEEYQESLEYYKWEYKRLVININSFAVIEGRTEPNSLLTRFNQVIGSEGETYQLKTEAGHLQYLETTGEKFPPKYICLPPDHNIMIVIRPATGPEELVHPLEVMVSTNNWVAETLLAMMKRGQLKDARALISVADAEELLLYKRRDPPSAAIGGYYILKAGELDRLHDWANNLANWFPWLPDGAIIHAWQLIKTNNHSLRDYMKIKERLLEAYGRGVPVYTEGVRLLYEGLLQLSAFFYRADREIEKTLEQVRALISLVDWNQGITTLNFPKPDYIGNPTPVIENIVSGSEDRYRNNKGLVAQAGG